MAKVNPWLVVSAIGIVFIALFGVYSIFKPTAQTVTGGQVTTTTTGGTTINAVIPTLTYGAYDSISKATAVGVTKMASINGGQWISAPATGTTNDKMDVLFINGTTHHNAVLKGFTVVGGANNVIGNLYGVASVTITAFNGNNQVLTNGGGINQTVTTGGAYNIDVRFDGQDTKSTSDMVCIVEGSDATKISSVKLIGATGEYPKYPRGVSGIYSQGAGSLVQAYEVPAIVGALSQHYTLYVASVSGQTMAGKYVKLSCLSKENFIDGQSGTLMYDVQDSIGTTAKNIATYTGTYYFE